MYNVLEIFFRRRFDFETDVYPKFADIKRLHSLDNDVRASGFTKELEKQFEEVSETIGLRQDVENDNHSNEDEDEDEEEEEENDEEEKIDNEPTSTLSGNDEITKLTHIIDTNHLLPSPTTNDFDENKNRQYKPFHDDNKEEEEENDDNDDMHSTVSTSQKLSTLSIDKDYVRAKVKQSLKKKLKQQHRRLCTKGEAALVTAQRRDQQETIQLHLE